MPISLTAIQAAAELRARGHDPQDVVVLSGGLWSAAFAFRENGRDFVVRFHERRDDLEKDKFAERWRSRALRIPRMVEIGESTHGPYGIAERVHGGVIDELDEAGMRAALPSLFAALDALRKADISGTRGYGLWHGDGNAEFATWREFVTRDVAARRDALVGTPVGTTAFDEGVAAIRELLPFANEDRHVVHQDLLNYNVRADEQGVILLDWGASIYGDFLHDWAMLRFWWPWFAKRWGGIEIGAEIAAHVRNVGSVPHFAERLRLCELEIGVDHISFQAKFQRWDDARWTAARTLELVDARLDN